METENQSRYVLGICSICGKKIMNHGSWVKTKDEIKHSSCYLKSMTEPRKKRTP